MRSTIRAQVLLGYAVPVVLVIVAAFIRQAEVDRATTALRWVAHTDQVIADANDLAAEFAFVDAKQRELAAKKEGQLGAVDELITDALRKEARLEELVGDNPEQLGRLRRFLVLVRQWRAFDADGAPDARATAEIRAVLREVAATEHALLLMRTRESEEASRRLQLAMVGLPMVTITLALLAGFIISGRIGRRVRMLSDTARALEKGEMTQRADVGGNDELRTLATAMNRMADRLVEREREVALLAELADAMQTSLDMEEAHEGARRLMLKATPDCDGTVLMHNASRNLLSRAFGWRHKVGDAAEIPLDEELAPTAAPEHCLALRRGRPHAQNDIAANGTCKHVEAKSGASLCIPLLAHGEIIGLLSLFRAETRAWDENQLALLRAIGEQLGLALANLQLRERLKNQSIRDPLTDLYNRRYLEATFSRELARAQRERSQVGVLIFDVDHFKRFNDTYGHDAGDLVLREVGALVKSSVRASDVPCRYGGEEFVVLFPDVDLETIGRRAERLREAVKARTVAHQGRTVGPVTISIGIALAPANGESLESVMAAADKALYAAKGAGRDCVVVAPIAPMPGPSLVPPKKTGAA